MYLLRKESDLKMFDKLHYANEQDKTKRKVVYRVDIILKPYRKKHSYIGMTKRELQTRINEHLTKKKSSVYQFLEEHKNEIYSIEISILYECGFEQLLDCTESLEIGKYILKNGTKANKRNRLINKNLKGFDKLTLENVKKCCNILINPLQAN